MTAGAARAAAGRPRPDGAHRARGRPGGQAPARRVAPSLAALAVACAAPWIVSATLPAGANEPAITYSTFLGSALADEAEAIAAVGDGLVVAGHTQGLVFPAGAAGRANRHLVNAFVARLAAGQPAEQFISVFQGSDLADGEEFSLALAVDGAGAVYAAGNTNSADFPVTAGVLQERYGGNIDGFVLKLEPDGTVAYATFLGGSDYDSVQAIAVDAAGTAYVAGGTWSADFPTTPDARVRDLQGQRDVFVARLDASGAVQLYGSYAGGSSQDQAEAIAVDDAGRIHVTGWTRSSDFGSPLRGATAPRARAAASNSPFDAFALRIDPADVTSDYAVRIGGTDEDRGEAIGVDATGAAIVAGRTASADFPVTASAFDSSYGGGVCSFVPCPDAFLARVSADGRGLVYATYFGGSAWDEARALAVDDAGATTLVGMTESTDLHVTDDALDRSLGGSRDAFVVRFAASGEQVSFASYLGGSSEEAANAVAVDEAGNTLVAGQSRSPDFPVTTDAFGAELAGDYDAFATVLPPAQADADGDGTPDAADTCIEVANADQRDSNGDGFGNVCDADLNDDCVVSFADLGLMRQAFFSSDADADLSGDGAVSFLDLALLKGAFFSPPGPSGIASCD